MPSFMTFFKRKEKAPAEVERLDWKLLERGAIALYHKGSVLSQDIAWFRQNGYVVHELDGAGWTTPASRWPSWCNKPAISTVTAVLVSWLASSEMGAIVWRVSLTTPKVPSPLACR